MNPSVISVGSSPLTHIVQLLLIPSSTMSMTMPPGGTIACPRLTLKSEEGAAVPMPDHVSQHTQLVVFKTEMRLPDLPVSINLTASSKVGLILVTEASSLNAYN